MVWYLSMLMTIMFLLGSVGMSWSQAIVDIEPETTEPAILPPLQLRETIKDINDRVRRLEMKMIRESEQTKKNRKKLSIQKRPVVPILYSKTKKVDIEIIQTNVNKRIWTWEKFDAQRKMRQETVGD